MKQGRVEIRSTSNVRYSVGISTSKRNSLHRLRFYGIDQERLDTILTALKLAKAECGTKFDSIALDAICMHFISTFSPNGSGEECSKTCSSK